MSGIDYETQLDCPRCGGPSMHHGRIEIYDRSEDEVETLCVVVDNSIVTTQELVNTSRNPSARRHGLRIWFWCEGCQDEPQQSLAIVQHKGTTYYGWET